MSRKSHEHSLREPEVKVKKPFKVRIEKLWLTAYNLAGLITALYILKYCLMDDLFGSNQESRGNIYARESSPIRLIFMVSEFCLFVEVIHYLIEISYMKVHIYCNILAANFILFFVIDFFPNQNWVPCWILVRCVNKVVRHFYHTYTAMGYKFKVYCIDWLRMSSFYVLYPTEYCLSIVLVLTTLPVVKSNKSFVFEDQIGISFDFAVLYFLYMCLSFPHFLNTCVYLHRKRLQQLYIANKLIEKAKNEDQSNEDQNESDDQYESQFSTPSKSSPRSRKSPKQ